MLTLVHRKRDKYVHTIHTTTKHAIVQLEKKITQTLVSRKLIPFKLIVNQYRRLYIELYHPRIVLTKFPIGSYSILTVIITITVINKVEKK